MSRSEQIRIWRQGIQVCSRCDKWSGVHIHPVAPIFGLGKLKLGIFKSRPVSGKAQDGCYSLFQDIFTEKHDYEQALTDILEGLEVKPNEVYASNIQKCHVTSFHKKSAEMCMNEFFTKEIKLPIKTWVFFGGRSWQQLVRDSLPGSFKRRVVVSDDIYYEDWQHIRNKRRRYIFSAELSTLHSRLKQWQNDLASLLDLSLHGPSARMPQKNTQNHSG